MAWSFWCHTAFVKIQLDKQNMQKQMGTEFIWIYCFQMVFSFHQNPQPLRHKHNDNPKSIASINLISWVKLILAGHLPHRHISPKSMTQSTRETHTPTRSTWANDWRWKEPMMVASKATRPPRLRTLRRFIHDPSRIKGSKTLFTSSNNLQRLEASCMINHFLLEVGRTPVKSALECKHV